MLKRIVRSLVTIFGAFLGYAIYAVMAYVLRETGTDLNDMFTETEQIWLTLFFVLIFAFIFFQLAPSFKRQGTKVATNIASDLQGVSGNRIFASAIGLIMGLVIAFLLTQMFSSILNPIVYTAIVFVVYGVCGFLGAVIAYSKGGEMYNNAVMLRRTQPDTQQAALSKQTKSKRKSGEIPKILDTSVIIDGRIADILHTGFLEGPIVIPEFVLVELRHIADSSDSLKRVRGRRGLDILKKIQTDFGVEIYNTDNEKSLKEIPEVDVKLLKLAQIMNGKVVTNDYNLNKVAAINDVGVLNINKLANCLKPVVLPGEEMTVHLVKQGKDPRQGIGYLDDGTMIVAEDGRKMVGETVTLRVTSVLQTSAGRMIFGRLKDGGKGGK